MLVSKFLSNKTLFISSLTSYRFQRVVSMGKQISSQYSKIDTSETQYINDITQKNCVVVFSKTNCSYCDKVKSIFNDHDVKFITIELDKREDGDQLQNVLSHLTGSRTVPRVFINGRCVGGAQETKFLHKEGKLIEMIKECENYKLL